MKTHLELVIVYPGVPSPILPKPVLPCQQDAAGVGVFTGQPILAITSLADSFSELAHVSMVGYVLHGQAAGAAAAAIGDALDLDEVWLAQV